MVKIFIDTNILIDFVNGNSADLAQLLNSQTNHKLQLFINPVVIAEYFTDQRLKNAQKLSEAEGFISNFEIVSIGRKEGLIAAGLMRNNLTYALGDALIASSCLRYDMRLLTRNIKHFQKVPKLQFYQEVI